MQVAGKVLVVTGGGAGIGRDVVLELLSRQARVAAVDLRPDFLAGTERLTGSGSGSGSDTGTVTPQELEALHLVSSGVDETDGGRGTRSITLVKDGLQPMPYGDQR
jgi:NAD(P)-dependent dehydrogenase (short-subunit alcohol dehydrogenase family)